MCGHMRERNNICAPNNTRPQVHATSLAKKNNKMFCGPITLLQHFHNVQVTGSAVTTGTHGRKHPCSMLKIVQSAVGA